MLENTLRLAQQTKDAMLIHLNKKQYTNGSKKNLMIMWDRITEYAISNKYTEFSEDWVMPFVAAYVESTGKTYPIERMRTFYRAASMLCEFQKYGEVRRYRWQSKLIKNKEVYQVFYDAVDSYAVSHQLHRTSKMNYVNEINKLVLFLEERGILSPNITLDLMREYLLTLRYMKQTSISQAHAILRNIMTILYNEGRTQQDLSVICERIHVPAGRNIPSVFTPEEIEKVLTAVDRANTTGKRDYAILLLAARLGLRVGDIRTLRFEEINWHTCEIRKVQNKTKNEIVLPLSEEIGLAIIDYVKNGRPKSDSPNIFIRHISPFLEFSGNYNFSDLLRKYLHRAGIKVAPNKPQGMHCLRHSLASNMLAAGTAMPVVSEILGHSKTDNTAIYLKVSIPQLRKCALDIDFGGDFA